MPLNHIKVGGLSGTIPSSKVIEIPPSCVGPQKKKNGTCDKCCQRYSYDNVRTTSYDKVAHTTNLHIRQPCSYTLNKSHKYTPVQLVRPPLNIKIAAFPRHTVLNNTCVFEQNEYNIPRQTHKNSPTLYIHAPAIPKKYYRARQKCSRVHFLVAGPLRKGFLQGG